MWSFCGYKHKTLSTTKQKEKGNNFFKEPVYKNIKKRAKKKNHSKYLDT